MKTSFVSPFINRTRPSATSAYFKSQQLSPGDIFEQLENRVLFSVYSPAQQQTAAETLPVLAAADAAPAPMTQIASSASGRQAAVYILADDGTPQAQLYDAAGQPIGDPIPVSEGSATGVSVATNAAGDFVVAWVADGGGQNEIMVRKFDHNGAALTDETRVDTDDQEGSDSPSVGMDDTGNFVVTWKNTISDNRTVVLHQGSAGEIYQYLDDNNHVASDVTPGDTEDDEETFDDVQILAQRFDASGNAAGNIFRVNQPTAQITAVTQGPVVSMGPTGTFSIAWSIETSKIYTTKVAAVTDPYDDYWYDDNDNEHAVHLKDITTAYTTQSIEPTSVSVQVRSFSASGQPSGAPLSLGSVPETLSSSLRKSATINALDVAGDGKGNVVVAWEVSLTSTPFYTEDGEVYEDDPVFLGGTSYFQVINSAGKSVVGKTVAFTSGKEADILETQVAVTPGGLVKICADITDDYGDSLKARQFDLAKRKMGGVQSLDDSGVYTLVEMGVTSAGDMEFISPDDASGGIINTVVETPKPNLSVEFGNVQIGGLDFGSATLPRGGTFTVPLIITNSFDSPADATGPVRIELFASTSDTLDDSVVPLPLPTAQQVKSINLKAGQSAKLKLKVTVPSGLDTGTYYLIARINGNIGVMEVNMSDNVVSTTSPSAG